jgi:hypothetical protein
MFNADENLIHQWAGPDLAVAAQRSGTVLS